MTSTHRRLRVNDIELHLELQGEGEPLLLLHGLTGSSQDWKHAGGGPLSERYQLIAVDARGHGRSTSSAHRITHRQCALDTLAMLEQLGIRRCKAIGMSFGGNTLLHLALLEPELLEAMVLVSATPYFPEQARRIMAALPPDAQPADAWQSMRERHHAGDDQIRALFELQYAMKDSYDDLCFTPPELGRIRARTLFVQGDRDPLYPVELTLEMYRALPRAALWVVPGAGHGPIFVERAPAFAVTALAFLQEG